MTTFLWIVLLVAVAAVIGVLVYRHNIEKGRLIFDKVEETIDEIKDKVKK